MKEQKQGNEVSAKELFTVIFVLIALAGTGFTILGNTFSQVNDGLHEFYQVCQQGEKWMDDMHMDVPRRRIVAERFSFWLLDGGMCISPRNSAETCGNFFTFARQQNLFSNPGIPICAK